MAWYKKRSQKAKADELLGKHLTLLADKPPTDTKFGGMKIVMVMDTEDSVTYRIMMTDNDIDAACECVREDLHFTFYKEKDMTYASVKPIKE